jgi:hypothetical protein
MDYMDKNIVHRQIFKVVFLILILILSLFITGCSFGKKDKDKTKDLIDQANLMLDDSEERANFNTDVITQTGQVNLNAQNTSGILENHGPRILIKNPKMVQINNGAKLTDM